MAIALLGLLGGLIGTVAEDWKAKRQNAREVERAVAENRIALAKSEVTHNQEWEMRQLEGADKWVRRLSFAMWSFPMGWAAFDAPGAQAFFRDALGALPEWYVWGYLSVTGAVWGISEFKAMGLGKKGS